MTDALIKSADNAKPRGAFSDYLSITRLDHSTKHIFIVPGIALAALLRGFHTAHPLRSFLAGALAAICIASANYVINEWLDRNFDLFHPKKSGRAAVQHDLRPAVIWTMWAGFAALGIACAAIGGLTMLAAATLFAAQGLVYNAPPLRTKDKAYLDVISESINNPLRLLIGWAIVDPTSLPPSSLIFAYWTAGAFLMAAKRLSEFIEIKRSAHALFLARYRASFATYTEVSLTISCFVYAMLSTFFMAVFLIKYRIEYLLCFPLLIALFAYYMAMVFQQDSLTQKPERLFRDRTLVLIVLALSATFIGATLFHLPLLDALLGQKFILV